MKNSEEVFEALKFIFRGWKVENDRGCIFARSGNITLKFEAYWLKYRDDLPSPEVIINTTGIPGDSWRG